MPGLFFTFEMNQLDCYFPNAMRNSLLFLSFLVFSMACTAPRPLNQIIKYHEKLEHGDTVGVREIFHDKIAVMLGNKFSDSISVEEELAIILSGQIMESSVTIRKILDKNDSMVILITNETQPYYFSGFGPDTVNYQMSYYFSDGKIYKIKTDTLLNSGYCYGCHTHARDKYLMEFLVWLKTEDSAFYHGQMKEHYDSRDSNPNLYLENTNRIETQLKEYYKRWEVD